MSDVAAPRARPRRSCLLVPGGSAQQIERSAQVAADEVVLDLEDTVPGDGKDAARRTVAAALQTQDWGDATVAVRINAVETRWAYRDVIEVAGELGEAVDCLVVPKVESPGELEFVDHLLRMLEDEHGHEHRIGLEAQIANAPGLALVDEIAIASDRLEALVLAPADLAASLGVPVLSAAQAVRAPGWDWVRQRVLVTARTAGLQAVDGPYPRVRDADGFRAAARAARVSGYDGTWVLDREQARIAAEVFTPSADQLRRAKELLATAGSGAVQVGDELVDEGARRLAEVTLLRARAAGVTAGSGRRGSRR